MGEIVFHTCIHSYYWISIKFSCHLDLDKTPTARNWVRLSLLETREYDLGKVCLITIIIPGEKKKSILGPRCSPDSL